MHVSIDHEYFYLFRPPRRQLANRFDWGDQDTVGICLKSIDPKSPQQFGFYLGKDKGDFIVLVVDLDGNVICYEVFDNLQELKTRWECD